jgi:integration host factor subunit alpha
MSNPGKTVTRLDLYDAVYQKVGLSRSESASLVELVLKEIKDCVARGESVKLASFGNFAVHEKGERMVGTRRPECQLQSPRDVWYCSKHQPL